MAAGLNPTSILHLPPTRMLEPQWLLTVNSVLSTLTLLIATAPLFDFGFDNLSVFCLLLVPNFWLLKVRLEGEMSSGPTGIGVEVAVGVAVAVLVAVGVMVAVAVAVRLAVCVAVEVAVAVAVRLAVDVVVGVPVAVAV